MVDYNDDDDIGPDDDNNMTNPPKNIEIDPSGIEHEDTRELEDKQPLTINNEPTDVNPITSTSDTYIDNPSDRSVRRSSRTPHHVKDYNPYFLGKHYHSMAATTLNPNFTFATIHPDTHMFLSYGADWDQVLHCSMTQLSMKAGMLRWGDKGQNDVSKELSQLHMRDTLEPINPKTLKKQEYDQVLESHLFLKEKRDKSIKGRMVAGGDKQRSTINKADADSHTEALEYVLLTATIDAKKGRDVATVDNPNAFITPCIKNEEDKVIMRLRGRLAELMAATAPEIYKQYVTIDCKGNKDLYVRTLNVIYGIMKAALLFYLKFVESLTSTGFVLNPYDSCVANTFFDRHQKVLHRSF